MPAPATATRAEKGKSFTDEQLAGMLAYLESNSRRITADWAAREREPLPAGFEYEEISDGEGAELSLNDEGDTINCAVCGEYFVMDDSDLCRHMSHITTPLFP